MQKKLKSEALKVNLEETRQVSIVIPESHETFIDLSVSHWGIHNRAKKCISEFHHPYSNRGFVVEELRKIVLSDYWFYSDEERPETAFPVLSDILEALVSSNMSDSLKESVLRTLLEFIEKITGEDIKDPVHIVRLLEILQKNLTVNVEIFIRCSGLFKKYLGKTSEDPLLAHRVFILTKKVYGKNIEFWKTSSAIETWYAERKERFGKDYTQVIDSLGRRYFKALEDRIDASKNFEDLTAKIPSFNHIATLFRRRVDSFEAFIEKFHYMFYLLHIPGMSGLSDRLLRDLNHLLTLVMSNMDKGDIFRFIDRLFELFEEFNRDHTSTVLDCIATVGKGVIDLDDSEDRFRVNYFEKKLIGFGFESPGLVYVDDKWKTHVNKNHLKNIRVWVEILKYAPSIPEKLLSALIVNLRLGGVYLSDTDLFQRDITRILNSNIAPFYKKVKQLSYIFPVYFNEIGAEGEIRQVTTLMDELSGRNDKLVHFLRKQVHIEGNNTLIELTEKIFTYWYNGNSDHLKPICPQDVFESINPDGRWFIHIHHLVKVLCENEGCGPEKFLSMEGEALDILLQGIPGVNGIDKKRFGYICRLYRLLGEKYSFDTVNIVSIIEGAGVFEDGWVKKFRGCLDRKDHYRSICWVYKFMGKLKSVILDPEPSTPWESIYYKRHIAFGIPSMYGIYREPKFEAMGLVFRLERVAAWLMDQLIGHINLNYISATSLARIYKILELFRQGMELDGIYNEEFNSNLQMFKYSLSSSSFTLEQYLNIFQFMAERIKEIISEYFIRSYEYSQSIIIPRLFFKEEQLSGKDISRGVLEKSEEFTRDMIANCFLLQKLDNFISSILGTLHNMIDHFDPGVIHTIMSYNPDLVLTPFGKKTVKMDNKIFLGEKGFFLKKLYLAGIPVPPAFVLTTEVFRGRDAIACHPFLSRELDNLIDKELKILETICGQTYGDPENPLLLSVRTGAAVSMPGAMDTFLNVGLNHEIAEALAKRKGFAWTAWDCYRRLLQSWGMASGIHRDLFDKAMAVHKEKYGKRFKVDLLPDQIRAVALAYKEILELNGVEFEEDPGLQLKRVIDLVFDSWSSDRAKVYREYLGISEQWGTAVIVQKMVFGNLHGKSGTGVMFTHNPMRGRPGVHLFGDYKLNSQGEDIVSGLVHALPVGRTQRKKLNLSGLSLQEGKPAVYKRLYGIARDLIENHGFSHQEIEFTFESDKPEDIYILQVRNQNIRQVTHMDVFTTPPGEMLPVGRGTGIGGGALSGVLVFDERDMHEESGQVPVRKTILVRPDTVPDDIGMIFKCDGLLTSRGGVTSHAAVTAVKIGKTCIVNCVDLIVKEEQGECVIGDTVFRAGDLISIDGNHGNIFKGEYPVKKTEIIFDKINKY